MEHISYPHKGCSIGKRLANDIYGIIQIRVIKNRGIKFPTAPVFIIL